MLLLPMFLVGCGDAADPVRDDSPTTPAPSPGKNGGEEGTKTESPTSSPVPSPAPPSDEPSNAAPFDCAQGGRKVLCDATKELCWRSALPDCRASQHESCETVVKAYRQVCPSKTATCTGTRAAGFTVECGP